MAATKVTRGSKYLVTVGNGATPEVFSAPCGITARDVSYNAKVDESHIPDCDNPDAPTWASRIVDGLDLSIKASGVMDTAAFKTIWWPWFESGNSKNVRILLDVPSSDGGGYHAGKFVLSGMSVKAEKRQNVEFDFELQSDGAVTWTSAT